MSTTKVRTNATGAAATVSKQQAKKKLQKSAPKPKPKSVPRPQAPPKPKMDMAMLENQLKLLKATISAIDYDGLAHLPSQDATNYAHFHQRTTTVLEPNANGELKFVATNEPDARLLVELDAPPANLQLVVPESEYVMKKRVKGARPYRVNFDALRRYREFKKHFWEHSNEIEWIDAMRFYKMIESTRFVNENGHRLRVPSLALTPEYVSYYVSGGFQTTTTTNSVANSWWYNAGLNNTMALTANSTVKFFNGSVLNTDGTTLVRWQNQDRTANGGTKPVAITSPSSVTTAALELSYPKGTTPMIYLQYKQDAAGTLNFYLYNVTPYVSTTGVAVAAGTACASLLAQTSQNANTTMSWQVNCTPPPYEELIFVFGVSATPDVNTNCRDVILTLPRDFSTPNPTDGWYAFPTIDAETITETTESLRVVGSDVEVSSFTAPINASGQITSAILPADFWEDHTLDDLTPELLNEIPDRRNAAYVEGARSFLPPFATQEECVSDNDIVEKGDAPMAQPTIAYHLSGLDPNAGSFRIQTGIHLEGPSVSQLFLNRSYPPDILAQQRVAAAASVIPHHNGNPLGMAAIGACLLAYKVASLAYPLIEETPKWLAKFKATYDSEYSKAALKIARG